MRESYIIFAVRVALIHLSMIQKNALKKPVILLSVQPAWLKNPGSGLPYCILADQTSFFVAAPIA